MYIVVINEAHTLTEQQAALIGEHERYNLPAGGATLAQAEDMAKELASKHMFGRADILIVSPFPALMVKLGRRGVPYRVLHKDKRVADEVTNPDGSKKVIHHVAPDGWEIV